MKRSEFILAILTLLVLTACDAVLGPPGSGDDILFPPPDSFSHSPESRHLGRFVEGQPNLNLMRVSGGYYIWKTGNSWHLRISRIEGPPTLYSRGPVFTGRIFVQDGVIFRLDQHQISSRPFNDVQYTMNDISFKIEPRGTFEGFDFEVRQTGVRYCITFDLQLNYGIPSNLVHLGSSLYVPDIMPLNMCFP